MSQMPSHLRRLLILLAAAALLVPAGSTLAESGPGEDGLGDLLVEDNSGSSDDNSTDMPDENQTDEADDNSGPGRSDEARDRERGPDRGDDEADDNETDEADDNSGPGRSDEARDHDDDDDDDELDDDHAAHHRAEAVRQNFRGNFNQSGSAYDGRFVSFALGDGGVMDYAVGDDTVFAFIAFDPALDPEDVETEGARFEAEGEDAEFQAVDNPTGFFEAEAEDGTLTLTLAPGYTATPSNDTSGFGNAKLLIEGPDNFTALLSGHRGLSVDGDTITAPSKVRFTVHAPGLRGDLSPKLDEAVEDGRLGAEILVSAAGDHPGAAAIAHRDLNITTEQAEGSVTITVEGHGNGTTLLFNIERDAIGRAEDLVIRFDGEVIRPADDLDDVLDTSADEPAEYLLIVGRNATQVLVGVPHFSVHTVQVQSLAVSLPPVPPGSIVAFAAAVLGAAAFVGATWAVRSRKH